jgi:PHS family inorganic phosphate transporter-like MFS transporter
VGSFSTAFNLINVSLVLVVMSRVPRFVGLEDEAARSTVSSTCLAGMIFGQLFFGFVGDWIGRRRAMSLTLAIVAIGALLSATASGDGVFIQLGLWRFLLGIGAGGVYPLAAVVAAESTSQSQSATATTELAARQRARNGALVFSMQGVGFLVAPLLVWALVATTGGSAAAFDWQWRVIVALGALPSVAVLWIQHKSAAGTGKLRFSAARDFLVCLVDL